MPKKGGNHLPSNEKIPVDYHESGAHPGYRAVQRGIVEGKLWNALGDGWPGHSLDNETGTVKGSIYMKPTDRPDLHLLYGEEERKLQAMMLEYAHEHLDDLMGDVFEAIMIEWLKQAKNMTDPIFITVDKIAQYRGIQNRIDSEGRSRGLHSKHRTNIAKRIDALSYVWVKISEATFYVIHEDGSREKMRLSENQPLLIIEKIYSLEGERGSEEIVGYECRPGKLIALGLFGTNRKTAILNTIALELDPKNKRYEKRLIRYLTYLWANRRKNVAYHQGIKVEKVLSEIGLALEEEKPGRTKDRLEKALDFLETEAKVINGWEYEEWDEANAPSRGWVEHWLKAKITIEPPDVVMDYYREHVKQPETLPSTPKEGKANADPLASLLRQARQQRGLSMGQTAEELGISKAMISLIENGKALPSRKNRERIERWIKQQE